MRVPLNTVLFPGVSSKVEVHTGFRNQHAMTATTILAEVERLVKAKGTQHVTVVGSGTLFLAYFLFTLYRLAIHLAVPWQSLTRYT